MKKLQPVHFTLVAAVIFLVSCSRGRAQIATWTFETSQPGVVTLPNSPGAGVNFTSVPPETGTGTATGFHAGASTYSSPAGNGSAHSFSSTLWAIGDYYQFAVSTAGQAGISVAWGQTSSSTGPGVFNFQYSTDGTNFTTYTNYTVLQNGLAPNASWNATTAGAAYDFAYDLSGVTALNNAATLYFRLTVATNTSAGGATIGTGGTSRVDNFSVTSLGSASGLPSITTEPATQVTPATATLNAAVTPGSATVNVWFQYGLTTNYGSVTATNQFAANTNSLAATNLLSGLKLKTPYHFRAIASNGGYTTIGADVAFTTLGMVGTNGIFYVSSGFLPGTYNFTFLAQPGQDYLVLSTTNAALPMAQWNTETDLATSNQNMYETTYPSALSSYSFTVQPPADGQIYYRVSEP